MLFVFLPISTYAEENLRIGKIDLAKALILHPKMSFFDYERLGFYKKDLINKYNYVELNNSCDLSVSREEIELIRTRIKDLNNKLSKIPPIADNKNNVDEIYKIQTEITELKNKISDIEFDINNSDITNVIETQKLLSDISIDVFKAIKEVAEEENIYAIFNNSELSNNNFPASYNDRSVFKNNSLTVFDNPYYVFLSDALKASKSGEIPSSVNLSNWLEYSRDPSLFDRLPIKTSVFVLDGAEDVLMAVIKKIYLQHNISLEDYKRLEQVLDHMKRDK